MKNKLPLRSIDDRWEADEYIFVEHDKDGNVGKYELTIWDDDLKVNFKALITWKEGFEIPFLLKGYVKNGKIKKRTLGGKVCVYFKNNIVHRDNGPAMIWKNKDGLYKTWFKNGVIHRDNGPAKETPVTNMWYTNGEVIKSIDKIKTLPEDMLKDSTPEEIKLI